MDLFQISAIVVVYIVVIIFSYMRGKNSGIEIATRSTLDVLVNEKFLQKIILPDGEEDITGTVQACPNCSKKLGDGSPLGLAAVFEARTAELGEDADS